MKWKLLPALFLAAATALPAASVPLAPQLRFPINGESIGAMDGPQRLNFSWDGIAGAASYRLQVARDSISGMLVVDSMRPRDSGWCNIDTGTLGWNHSFRWRVCAIDSNGQQGEWSEVYRFTLGYPDTTQCAPRRRYAFRVPRRDRQPAFVAANGRIAVVKERHPTALLLPVNRKH